MINTRIICTIGPASNTFADLKKMSQAGMNIVRLNMSHGDQPSHLEVINMVQQLNQEVDYPVGLLLDTQGPEIRTGVSGMILTEGKTIAIVVPPQADDNSNVLFVNYPHLPSTVNIGDRITVDSGLINLQVTKKEDNQLWCKVLDGGEIKPRRHVNLPGIHVQIPALTNKDKSDILFGIENDIDFIALSFVRDKNAIVELRELLGEKGRQTKIIAKIENYEGVNNLEEIIREVDGIMVARGDLGIEVDMEDLPTIQRQIAYLCAIHGKCLIIATHLLESMIENPIPTRAEITDIANAVFEEADAIMLSGETASGKYPVKAIDYMVRTARKAEQSPGVAYARQMIRDNDLQHIALAAVQLVGDLKLKGIVTFSQSGRSAAIVSNCRPANIKIFAFTNSAKTQKTLILYRAVYPILIQFETDFEETVQKALHVLRAADDFAPGDRVVVIHEIKAQDKLVPTIQVRRIE
ncbi:pyruvate kinase [bacterium]|nr:pyruvate kinase [bacterium]